MKIILFHVKLKVNLYREGLKYIFFSLGVEESGFFLINGIFEVVFTHSLLEALNHLFKWENFFSESNFS